MPRSRLVVILPALLICAMGYYGLAFGRIVLNGTTSLRGNAYAMVTWPLILRPGVIVATALPEVLRDRFGDHGLYLTKRIVGVAGDPVQQTGTTLCIKATCVEGLTKDGQLVTPLWKGDTVPQGMIALFGDSPDSLDSRYAIIGPRPVTDVIAAGIEIPFPHWTELQEWWQ